MQEIYSQNEGKKPWKSKTLWANAILAIAAFFPVVNEFITPEGLGTAFAVVNTILRFATKEKIVLN